MNFRDVELLSAYLDGQASPSDSTRLEARLKTDPELASALESLRESRTLLRRLPKRRAPRNFTLTPRMVGKRPPLPRSYPIFRFSTVLATVLFVLASVFNRTAQYAASTSAFGLGMGGAAPASRPYSGGGGDTTSMEPAATQPPATEPPSIAQAPQPTAEAQPTQVMGMSVVTTPTPEPPAEANRTTDVPPGAAGKSGGSEPATPAPAPTPFQIPAMWLWGFGLVALIGAAAMFVIQRSAASKWHKK